MAEKVRFHSLLNTGDHRGDAFTIPPEMSSFLGRIADVHVSSVVPGEVRGNHYHKKKRRAIVIFHESDWSFHWDGGENTSLQSRSFCGQGAEMVFIEPNASQAVRNTGNRTLVLVAFSSEPYDPRETVARKVV